MWLCIIHTSQKTLPSSSVPAAPALAVDAVLLVFFGAFCLAVEESSESSTKLALRFLVLPDILFRSRSRAQNVSRQLGARSDAVVGRNVSLAVDGRSRGRFNERNDDEMECRLTR
jgi:hypothetical protein